MCPLFVKLSYLLLYPGQLVKTKLSVDQKALPRLKTLKKDNLLNYGQTESWSCLPSGLKTLYNNPGSCNCLVCFK